GLLEVGIIWQIIHQGVICNLLRFLQAYAGNIISVTIIIGAASALRYQIIPIVGHTAVGVYATIVGCTAGCRCPVLTHIGIGVLSGFGIRHAAHVVVAHIYIFAYEPVAIIAFGIDFDAGAKYICKSLVESSGFATIS